MKVRLLFAFILFFSPYVKAQQVATYAQYMFNGLAINPAYAGSHDAMSATLLARFQNVGLNGAPNTQTFSIHSPLPNKRVGLGLLVINDQIGVIDQKGVHASYAYRLPMPKIKGVLSMGLQAGISSYRALYSELDQWHMDDPAFASDVRQTRPNFGAGVMLSSERWYAGVSMPHLANNVFDRGADLYTVYQNVPLMVSGGYVFDLNRMLKLKPNLLFKLLDGRAVEFDLNTMLLFDEVIWFGVSYKFNNSLAMLTQFQITDQLQFGYSYTITTGSIRRVELGSHEVMLNYRFKFNKQAVISPRYF